MSLITGHRPIGIEDNNLPNIEAIYIHIPFCQKKCNYCDFISYPLEGLPVKEYCTGVLQEGALYQRYLSANQQEIKSLYIGGGTPTCLPAEYLIEIINGLRGIFPVRKDGEITVEANPLTIDQEYLYGLREAGVNRLSIGAQSFDQKLLKEMGRIHGRADIIKAVLDAREAGFTNINLDLIYGLPEQTENQWMDTLTAAAALPVTHLSVYGLKLSEDSFWGKRCAKGYLILPDEDASAEMQELAMDYLREQGYDHYEIANFALPGYFSVHNRVYWNNENYLGLGVAASSHWGNIRQTNLTTLPSYLEELKRGRFPTADWEAVDKETEMGETIFLGLRLLSGLDIGSFEQRFRVDFENKYRKQIEKLMRLGLVEYTKDMIKLTRKGIFLANEVFIEFLP